MKKMVYFTIDQRVSEDKAEVRKALKQGAEVSKVVRIEYLTGPTRIITASITTITNPKEVR